MSLSFAERVSSGSSDRFDYPLLDHCPEIKERVLRVLDEEGYTLLKVGDSLVAGDEMYCNLVEIWRRQSYDDVWEEHSCTNAPLYVLDDDNLWRRRKS